MLILLSFQVFTILTLLSSSGVAANPEEQSRCFQLEIEDIDLSSAYVESVRIDPIRFDVIELETPTGADYRVYGPGDAHYGSITIRARMGNDSKELYQWWLDTSRGKNIRKNISVIANKRDGSEARRFNVFECFPTRWDPGEYSPSSDVAVETIVCKMGRVELAVAGPDKPSDTASPETCSVDLAPGIDMEIPPGLDRAGFLRVSGGDQVTRYKGFKIEIKQADGSGGDVDSAWETCTGGSLNIELITGGQDSCQQTAETSGHKYVDEVTLKGPLTSGRKDMVVWFQETAAIVGSKRRGITLTEVNVDGKDGRTYTYLECFLTQYTFPSFGTGTGNLYEEVAIKPIRLELS